MVAAPFSQYASQINTFKEICCVCMSAISNERGERVSFDAFSYMKNVCVPLIENGVLKKGFAP